MIIRSDGKTLPQWECEVSIDVNSMTLSLKPTEGICAAGYGSGKLRRFATPPCSTNPGHPLSTNWKWYWEDNGGVWCMYEKDHLVNFTFIVYLQTVFEILESPEHSYVRFYIVSFHRPPHRQTLLSDFTSYFTSYRNRKTLLKRYKVFGISPL